MRLTGGKEERDERPNPLMLLAEGRRRIEIRLGADMIGLHEDDFAAGEDYYIHGERATQLNAAPTCCCGHKGLSQS